MATKAYDSEDFDNAVGDRKRVLVPAIRAKLAAGDNKAVEQIDDIIGGILFSTADWSNLIRDTAAGQNAFAAVLDKAINDAAEVQAIKDIEDAAEDAAEDHKDSFYHARQAAPATIRGPWRHAARH